MFTNEETKALRERNEARMKVAKEQLGSRWLLHKDNSKQKTPETRILQ